MATAVKGWITGVGARTTFIEPGSPWENGYVKSFNGKLLNAEVFNTLAEAKVLIEQWRRHYNTVCPRSSLGYRPPAPEVVMSDTPTGATHETILANYCLIFALEPVFQVVTLSTLQPNFALAGERRRGWRHHHPLDENGCCTPHRRPNRTSF